MEVIREELELVREHSVTNVVPKSPLTAPTSTWKTDHTGRCGGHAFSPGLREVSPLSEYEAQRRGGKGKSAARIKKKTLLTDCWWRTPTTIFCVLQPWSRLFDEGLPVARSYSGARGRPIVNLLPLEQDERITRSCR